MMQERRKKRVLYIKREISDEGSEAVGKLDLDGIHFTKRK